VGNGRGVGERSGGFGVGVVLAYDAVIDAVVDDTFVVDTVVVDTFVVDTVVVDTFVVDTCVVVVIRIATTTDANTVLAIAIIIIPEEPRQLINLPITIINLTPLTTAIFFTHHFPRSPKHPNRPGPIKPPPINHLPVTIKIATLPLGIHLLLMDPRKHGVVLVSSRNVVLGGFLFFEVGLCQGLGEAVGGWDDAALLVVFSEHFLYVVVVAQVGWFESGVG